MITQSTISGSRELPIMDTDLLMFLVTKYAILFQKHEKHRRRRQKTHIYSCVIEGQRTHENGEIINKSI